ncbi:MAG: flagellar hook-length control protein FliK, partial [Pseudomonadota bacterium]
QQVRQSQKADAKPTEVEETAAAVANEEEQRADEAKAPEPSEPGGAHPHHQPHFMVQLIAAQAQQAIAQAQQNAKANATTPQTPNATTPQPLVQPTTPGQPKPARPTKQTAKTATPANTPPAAKTAIAPTTAQQAQSAQTQAPPAANTAQQQAATAGTVVTPEAPVLPAPTTQAPAAAPTPQQGAQKQTPAIDGVAPTRGDAKARSAQADPKMQTPATPTERANTATNSNSAPSAAPKAATKAAAAITPAPQQAAQPATPTPTAAPASAASDTRASAVDAAQQATRATPIASQVGHEIVKRFNGETTRFQMRLDPPELGRIDVRLDVSRDHRVTAVISADNPQALSDLSRATRDLQQALQSAGLELADNGLSFDLKDQSSGFSANEERNAQRGNAQSANGTIITEEPQTASRPVRLESWRGARIDLVA